MSVIHIMEDKRGVIKISYGMRFSPHTNWVAYLVTLLFIIAFATSPDTGDAWIAVPFLGFILLVMITATNGLKIHICDKKYQYYFSVLGISVGKWKKYNGYSCIVIKTSRKKQERRLTRYFDNRTSSIKRFVTTEVYLMDTTHRKKIFCGSFDKVSEAKRKAKELCKKLNYPIE